MMTIREAALLHGELAELRAGRIQKISIAEAATAHGLIAEFNQIARRILADHTSLADWAANASRELRADLRGRLESRP